MGRFIMKTFVLDFDAPKENECRSAKAAVRVVPLFHENSKQHPLWVTPTVLNTYMEVRYWTDLLIKELYQIQEQAKRKFDKERERVVRLRERAKSRKFSKGHITETGCDG